MFFSVPCWTVPSASNGGGMGGFWFLQQFWEGVSQ